MEDMAVQTEEIDATESVEGTLIELTAAPPPRPRTEKTNEEKGIRRESNPEKSPKEKPKRIIPKSKRDSSATTAIDGGTNTNLHLLFGITPLFLMKSKQEKGSWRFEGTARLITRRFHDAVRTILLIEKRRQSRLT